MTDTVIIACGDLHINSSVALSPPIVNLDDSGTYHASRVQRWLWECWLDQCSRVAQIKARRKIVLLNGDVGELDTRRRSNQLISPNKATIQAMVIETLAPLVDAVDSVFIIRGTQAHTGKSAWLEEAIAADLSNSVPQAWAKDGRGKKKKAPASWYHLRAEFSGVRFDIAHHASMGNLPWTEKNAANKVASVILWRYLVEMKQPAPHVALRSHNHRYNDSGNNFDVYVVMLACWTVATEYVYRVGQENAVADIGSSVFYCDNGAYRPERWRYAPKEARRIWQAM